jgi:Transposase DDE domain
MRHIVDPRQTKLFDPFEGLIPPLGRKRIDEGWQTLFRNSLLQLMPVRELGKHFDPVFGRPSKELYSTAGLLFLQEMNDWTNAEAVDAYLFRTDVQYALNLEPGVDEMCDRTLERHRALFVEDELAAKVMDRLTGTLIEKLQLAIDQQRLDSTHTFSNMASFGRTRLMGVAIKRFLTQVKRHHEADYLALPEELRERYASAQSKLFASKGQSAEDRNKTRQQVAEDLHALIERFADHAGLQARSSYKALATIFEQQCEIVDAKIQVRTKTGGDCMQNPSDPDATYDGQKGQGYQVQLSETCSEENDVQLIVAALPQTAVSHDAEALEEILDDLKANDRLPETMLLDTAYGGDENTQKAAAMGVDLVSPVAGPKGDVSGSEMAAPTAMEPLTIDDFAADERTGKVTACPIGRIPLETIYDAKEGTTTIEMRASDCENCPSRASCPIKKNQRSGRYKLTYTDKQRRLEARRQEEKTDVFKEQYARRSGIESTNSGLKRRLGLGRLRVRGRKAVFHAIYLKVAGWNLLRAAAKGRLSAERVAAKGFLGPAGRFWRMWTAFWTELVQKYKLPANDSDEGRCFSTI